MARAGNQPGLLTLRLGGAAHLVYLGVRPLLAPKGKLLPSALASPKDETVTRAGRPRAFRQRFLCDMANPRTLPVSTGMISQFVPATSAPFLPVLLG